MLTEKHLQETELTEKDLKEMEKLLDNGPDDAFREREVIERLISEVRRLTRERKEAAPGAQN